MSDLKDWIAFYKLNRDFLHSSDIVRCETPDETIWLHGVVTKDKSRALFQMVTRGRSAISPRGRLRFSGLDDSRTYTIRPVIVGSEPSGLVPPLWFGELSHPAEDGRRYFDGITTTGSILQNSGVQTPRLHTDQTLLFEIVEK